MKLMRKKRIESMEKFMLTNGRVATGDTKSSISTKTLDRVKRELATTSRKLSAAEKKCGLVDVSFCKWYKRARRHCYNTHDSKDCTIKFPNLNKHKKQRP